MNKLQLEAVLSKVCGFPVEITIRSTREFTLSAEGNHDFTKAINYLCKSQLVVKHNTEYDAECDMTFFYFTVKQ